MPRHARAAPYILGFWTVLGLLESSKAWLGEQLQGPGNLTPGVAHGWGAALIGNMPWWLLWAAMTPLIFRLAERCRLDTPRWPLAALVHLAAGTVLSVIHVLVAGSLYYYTNTRGGPIGSLSAQVESILDNFLVVEIMTYFAVVGAWYAIDYARRARERERAALESEARAASLEAQMTEARLGMLRRQLDPHFLFNSLNSVSGLVRRGDGSAAVDMLARVGDLLRLSLEQCDTQQVTLEEELACIDTYLEIEHTRLGPRLTVARSMEAGVMDALVPAFLLQPLVENAIRHGIARIRGPGRVSIAARAVDDMLLITITDTGAGLAPTSDRGTGIGLANARARLATLHGDAASLVLQPRVEGGVEVSVTLPLTRAELPGAPRTTLAEAAI